MSTAYYDASSDQEVAMPVDCQPREAMCWDGKYVWALNGNDLIQSDPQYGEVFRVTLTAPSGGTYKGITFTGRYFVLLSDDGAGLINMVWLDRDGTIIRSFKVGNDYSYICYLNRYFYVVRRSTSICQWTESGVEQRTDFYAPGVTLGDIATDGKFLYVPDLDSLRIHQVSINGDLIFGYSPPSTPIGPLTFNGKYLIYGV